jgi:hypothetical protein
LQSALLTLLPLALAVIAWSKPGERWMQSLWTLLGATGATYFLAMLARNQGKRVEPGLWQSWGGPPTTQLLRHAGPANPVLRDRWHKSLARLLGKPFPTSEEERNDPAAADRLYEAAVRLLIEQTRDAKRLPLVFKENVHYGFCRNLYAMRPTGIVVSSIALLASVAAGIWFAKSGRLELLPWCCAAVSGLLLYWWISNVTRSWVRIPALAYAERLLESTKHLSAKQPAEKEPDKK